jgi:hypothetical protein
MERIRSFEMQLASLRRLETRTRNVVYARPKRFRSYLCVFFIFIFVFVFSVFRSSPELAFSMIKQGWLTALRSGIV